MTPEEDPGEDDWENLEVDGSELEWDENFEPHLVGLQAGEEDTVLGLDFLKEDIEVDAEDDDDLDDSSQRPRRRRRSIFDEDEEADWSWRP